MYSCVCTQQAARLSHYERRAPPDLRRHRGHDPEVPGRADVDGRPVRQRQVHDQARRLWRHDQHLQGPLGACVPFLRCSDWGAAAKAGLSRAEGIKAAFAVCGQNIPFTATFAGGATKGDVNVTYGSA